MQSFINNWSATLTADAAADATLLLVAPDLAAKLVDLASGGFYLATAALLDEQGKETAWEIIKVTARSGGQLTAERGQEGTVALDLPAGTTLSARLTAGTLEAMRPAEGGDGFLSKSAFVGQINNGALGKSYDPVLFALDQFGAMFNLMGGWLMASALQMNGATVVATTKNIGAAQFSGNRLSADGNYVYLSTAASPEGRGQVHMESSVDLAGAVSGFAEATVQLSAVSTGAQGYEATVQFYLAPLRTVFFRNNEGATTWTLTYYDDGGDEITVSTGVALSTAAVTFRVEFNATNVVMKIGATTVATVARTDLGADTSFGLDIIVEKFVGTAPVTLRLTNAVAEVHMA